MCAYYDQKIHLRLSHKAQSSTILTSDLHQAVRHQLQAWPRWPDFHRVLAYQPMAHEVDLSPLWQLLPDKKRQWLFPRMLKSADNQPAGLTCHALESIQHWQTYASGFQEPERNAPVSNQLPQLCLIPCLAVDTQGYRLGSGYGYYDRFLSQWSGDQRPVTLGIVPQAWVLPTLPHEPWDIPLDGYVTESGIYLVTNHPRL